MKSSFLVLLLIFFCFSCSPEEAEKSSGVGSDILISLKEAILEEGKGLAIVSETAEIFPCFNYNLITKQRLSGDGITMTYTGIFIPELCLTALGPATSREYFSLENGTYSITFVNSGVSNEGRLIVDEEKYVLELTNATNVRVKMGTVIKTAP